MESIPTDLIQFGLEGVVLYFVWNQFQQNKTLIKRLREKDEQILNELSSRDDRLLSLINHLLNIQNSNISPP